MNVDVFISYSHRDEELCDRLQAHLAILQRLGHIVGWHDRMIGAGSEWAGEIDEHLRSAKIILLLISADFLASDYCYDVETRLALERHERGEAVVIPIILRPVDWTGAPFAKLQALPRDARAVTLWTNQDEAFALIARGIREAATRLAAAGSATVIPPSIEPASPPLPAEIEGERVLDAAIAQHVSVGRPTELLVQIRRTESGGLRALVTDEPEIRIDPDQVRSKPFELSWPVGPDGKPRDLRVLVSIDAPSFSPPKQTKTILVPPDEDSEVCSFLVTPQQTGPLLVQVELNWEDAARASRTLRTRCEAEGVAARPALAGARMPMNVITIPAFSTTPGGLHSNEISAAPYAASPAQPSPLPAPKFPVPAAPALPPVPEPLPPSPIFGIKAVAAAAMLVLVFGAGTLSVLQNRSSGTVDPPERSMKQSANGAGQWQLSRTSQQDFELRTQWAVTAGVAGEQRGYRITGVPAEAGLDTTVQCKPGAEQSFTLRPSRPGLLQQVVVCKLLFNPNTKTWDRTKAECRTLAAAQR